MGYEVTADRRCQWPLGNMKPMTAFASPTSSLLWFDYARCAWATGACEAGECDGEALIAVPLDHDNSVLRIGATIPTFTRTS